MLRETYCSFECAQLLKKKGFDWEVNGYYCSDVNNPSRIEWETKNYNSHKFHVSAPTQQMALRWLKETHGLWVITMPCENGDCYFEIYKRYGKIWKNNVYDHTEYENFDEQEDAIEAALQYCLTNLI